MKSLTCNIFSFALLISSFYISSIQSFHSWGIAAVERKVENAINSIHQILNFNKNPTFAANVPHTYDDKFLLVEYLVDIGLTSHLESLKLLGLKPEKLTELSQLSQNKSILLRFSSIEKCNFLREESHQVETGEREVQEGVLFTTSTKKFRIIKEYFWNFEVDSTLLVCIKGGGKEDCSNIINQKKVQTLKTSANQSPRPEIYSPPPLDLDATWFFRESSHSSEFVPFHINRTDKACYTPVRNRESLAALKYFDSVIVWTGSIEAYYRNLLVGLEQLWQSSKDEKGILNMLSSIQETIFIPVIPIMIASDEGSDITSTEENTPSVVVSTTEGDSLSFQDKQQPDKTAKKSAQKSTLFLNNEELEQCFKEELRTLHEGLKAVEAFMSERSQMTVISTGHVNMLLISQHMNGVSRSLVSAVMSVEEMLEKQLFSAIGREVTVDDVDEYMKLRGQQLFIPEFQPSPMTYALRRSPNHSPEGTFSLERNRVGGLSKRLPSSSTSSPVIHTVVRKERMGAIPTNSSLALLDSKLVDRMSFALNDASRVTISGERYIHSYLHHQFFYESSPSMSLAFRARQFSSFVVLLGTISSSTTFEPVHAFILQNKDEMRIPLEMEFIPSLKEFRRAISSLSPEQKQFAEAIRELQMSNTLFGVVVIQIKPQLEKVLNLPQDSLTKEIGLTEDLLKLFIEYQIPSDLLSYDELLDGGEESFSPTAGAGENTTVVTSTSNSVLRSVEKVREHVTAINMLINKFKEEELQEKKREDDFHNRRGSTIPAMHSPTVRPSSIRMFAADMEAGSVQGGSVRSEILTKSAVLAEEVFTLSDAPPSHSESSSETETETETIPQRKVESETDLSALPTLLQNYFDRHGSSQSIRPGIIRTGPIWQKRHQDNFFTPSREIQFNLEDQQRNKHRAFDLLDALTRSGGLTIDDASVHVILASSHYFPQTLLETVIERNMNPLIKLEESTLLMSSIIHNKKIEELIVENEKKVIQTRHTIP